MLGCLSTEWVQANRQVQRRNKSACMQYKALTEYSLSLLDGPVKDLSRTHSIVLIVCFGLLLCTFKGELSPYSFRLLPSWAGILQGLFYIWMKSSFSQFWLVSWSLLLRSTPENLYPYALRVSLNAFWETPSGLPCTSNFWSSVTMTAGVLVTSHMDLLAQFGSSASSMKIPGGGLLSFAITDSSVLLGTFKAKVSNPCSPQF